MASGKIILAGRKIILAGGKNILANGKIILAKKKNYFNFVFNFVLIFLKKILWPPPVCWAFG